MSSTALEFAKQHLPQASEWRVGSWRWYVNDLVVYLQTPLMGYCPRCKKWLHGSGLRVACVHGDPVAFLDSKGRVDADWEHGIEWCPLGYVRQDVVLRPGQLGETNAETGRRWAAAMRFVYGRDAADAVCAQALDGLRALHRGTP